MSFADGTDRRDVVRLRQLRAPSPWEGALLPLSAFPVPEDELVPARAFLQRLVTELMRTSPLIETFIRFAHLHLGDGPSRLSGHGRLWMPMMGLGVWPDRKPPTTWTLEELQDLAPGEKVRPLMDIVLRVTGSPEARNQARDVMLGLGTVIHLISAIDGEELLAATGKLLLPAIQDPSLTAFPFYMPLLEAKTAVEASVSQFDAWSCGIDAYIRESPEDSGILILARSLEQTLLQIGAVHSTAEPNGWEVPWR